MSNQPPSAQEALELALLNRDIASGFNFAWRSTSRTGVYILEDSRGPSVVVWTSPSTRVLKEIYHAALVEAGVVVDTPAAPAAPTTNSIADAFLSMMHNARDNYPYQND